MNIPYDKISYGKLFHHIDHSYGNNLSFTFTTITPPLKSMPRSNKRGEQLNIKPRGFAIKRKRSLPLNGTLAVFVALIFFCMGCVYFALLNPNDSVESENGGPQLFQDTSVVSNKNEMINVVSSNSQMGGVVPIENQKKQEENYHLVFSTSCSDFQKWQSYLLFYHAMKVSQPGRVIRIASGCEESDWGKEKEWHQQHISNTMSKNFVLHLTPSFSQVKGKDGKTIGDYKYFNKPFGLKHWMENDPYLGYDPETKKLKNEDAIIILIDPDMVLTRPITDDFSNIKVDNPIGSDRKLKVEHGSPFAQKYGLGSQWRRFDLDNIAGSNSPSKLVSADEGNSFYPAGPRKYWEITK